MDSALGCLVEVTSSDGLTRSDVHGDEVLSNPSQPEVRGSGVVRRTPYALGPRPPSAVNPTPPPSLTNGS